MKLKENTMESWKVLILMSMVLWALTGPAIDLNPFYVLHAIR